MTKQETRERLYLDDFHVGQRYISESYKMEAAEIKEFAGKYDPQPFHLDEEAAKHSMFGGLVVSGWHTAAVSMKLLVTEGPPVVGGSIGMGGEITWLLPTRAGDTLRVECEVVEIKPSRSKPMQGTIIFRLDTLNQNNEIVQTFVGKMIVPRRPGTGG